MGVFFHNDFFGLLHFARQSFHVEERDSLPARKSRFVLGPEAAPKTILRNRDYPPDFHLYTFAGPMIEQVRFMNNDAQEVRCPALVARMVRKKTFTQGLMIGAASMEEMTCSLRDLRTYKNDDKGITGHPQTESIARELEAYYETKVASRKRESKIAEIDFMHLAAPPTGEHKRH